MKMKIKRSSGLLIHITSLPGKHGIGTLGKEAYRFVDLLKEGGQKYWQILPFGPVSPGYGYSPYSSTASFAGNDLFIDLEMLQKEEWMRTYIMSDLPVDETGDFVDFDRVCSFKLPLLKNAAGNFFKYAEAAAKEDFHGFCRSEETWLDDYALFTAIARHYDNFDWSTWDKDIRLRTPAALEKWQERLKEEIDFYKFVQYVFYKQWTSLKTYANNNGIRIIGDTPIYVNFDSAETWVNPGIFQLDEKTLAPLTVAGVPPDYFSPTGQRWGNPLYIWWENGQLKQETLDWWAGRLKHMFTHFDFVRLDHFRGFESYWAIPAAESTAINGRWEKGPGFDFFKKMNGKLKELPVIAEDLGVITPPVERLRDRLKIPGMKILQFAFDFNNKNPYLPHNYTTTNCVVYTGTHDNDTSSGWFYGQDIDEKTRDYIMKYLNRDHREEFHWQLIRLALSSIAGLAIIPMQDIIGYAGKSRMNTPGKVDNNWRWKLTAARLTPEIMRRLKNLCIMYNRA